MFDCDAAIFCHQIIDDISRQCFDKPLLLTNTNSTDLMSIPQLPVDHNLATPGGHQDLVEALNDFMSSITTNKNIIREPKVFQQIIEFVDPDRQETI